MERALAVAVTVVLAIVVTAPVPKVAAKRWIVGGNSGWSNNVNYTVWAKGKHFYNGEWLFFVYDRNQMNVLEVNKTDYESCNANKPLHNWTTGAGRDIVPLNVTRHYYFISGNGYCYGGMKLAVRVENPPPPPAASPIKAGASLTGSTHFGLSVLPGFVLVGAMWDLIILLL